MDQLSNATRILLVSAQPDAMREKMGLSRKDEEQWFCSTLGIDPDSGRLEMISVADDEMPTEITHDAVIIGGSAYSVNDKEPWMRDLKQFIKKVHSKGIPLLGVCFGAQILAEAFGGSVKQGEKIEVGLVGVELTEEGLTDPLFLGVEKIFDIYAYHQDGIFELTDVPEVKILAQNASYPVQAFAVGETTRGVQFHPEIGRQRIEQALSQRRQSLIDERKLSDQEFETLMNDLEVKEFDGVRRKILNNFVQNFVGTKALA